MAKPRLLIRADAGEQFGLGHVIRMTVLAQAYMKLGGEATIVSAQCPDSLLRRPGNDELEFIKISGISEAEDVRETLEVAEIRQPSWIVLDGYHFSERYHKAVKAAAYPLMVADDFGHSEFYQADAILNANPLARRSDYSKVNRDTHLFLGIEYVFLGSHLIWLKENGFAARELESGIGRLLIAMGGTDSGNFTRVVIEALNDLQVSQLEIRVVLGPSYRWRSELESYIFDSNLNVRIYTDVMDMGPMYEWADAVVGAGGGTCWEWLLFEKPGLVIPQNQGQEPMVDFLVRNGVAQRLNLRASKDSITNFLANPIKGKMEKLDGRGAHRVAEFLFGEN